MPAMTSSPSPILALTSQGKQTPSSVLPSNMKESSSISQLQIFLGGSCNPTTWRQSVAIPYLELNGISYYNPQVDNWTPEVVSIERCAKQNAKVLLFVIDRQTRSTVSLIESAFIAGRSRNLVLVIYDFEYNVICCKDTSLHTSSLSRTTESKMSKAALESNKFPLSTSSSNSSSYVLHSSSTSLTNDHVTQRVSSTQCQASSKTCSTSTTRTSNSTLVSEMFSDERIEIGRRDLHATKGGAQQSSDILLIDNESISAEEFQELKRARQLLQSLMVIRRVPMFSDILKALKHVTGYLTSCNSISSEHEKSDDTVTRPLLNHQNLHDQSDKDKLKDVYFSLDGDDQTNIASSIISILNEKGLSYNFKPVNNVLGATKGSESVVIETASTTTSPQTRPCELDQAEHSDQPLQSWQRSAHQSNLESSASRDGQVASQSELAYPNSNTSCESDMTKLAIEREICTIRGSRVILFVISNKCRGLSIMVLASHFMALFKENVVLCVQYLEEPCLLGGERLSKNAIADYNRGRVYLCDYAVKSHIPVFSNIRDAVECCSAKCGQPGSASDWQSITKTRRRRLRSGDGDDDVGSSSGCSGGAVSSSSSSSSTNG